MYLGFQGIKDDNDISDTSGPPNPSPGLELQSTSSQQAYPLDFYHFFTGMSFMEPSQGGIRQELPLSKVCKLCLYV